MRYKILISLILVSASVFLWKSFEEFEKSSQKQMEYKPIDWFYQQRAFPNGDINRDAYQAALKQSSSMHKNPTKSLGTWELAGPVNVGGRLTDVEINPLDENVIYIGAASGGVFKSNNAGLSFAPIFDESLSLSIGDIALAPSNPDVIYVGTGEANPGGGSLAYDGNGMYKSADGGDSWSHIGLDEIGSVGRVVVSPNDPNTAYVAAMGYLFENNAERGVFKTTDGGANWEKVLFINDSTGAIDLAIHPTNPDIIYAATWERVRRLEFYTYGGEGCGIYKSEDGGENWEELDSGLPSGINVGRIGIGISQSEPDILYAIYADSPGYFEGMYKTENGGDSWSQTNDGNMTDLYASYGWWFGRLKVDPQDADIVYAIGFYLYKTENGGSNWFDITNDVHVDQHEIAISPTNSNLVYLGNDGGLYKSDDGGNNMIHHENLPITQFYTTAIDALEPQRLYGGAQDNGTNRTYNGAIDNWNRVYGGDGFYCLIDPEDNKYVYAEYQYGNLARSTNFGNSFYSAIEGISSSDRKNWNTPVVMNPQNPSSLYYGANRVYKSTNRAQNWQLFSGELSNGEGSGNQKYGTITTLAVSPVDTNIVYAGTDDANVWVTLDNGNLWTKISDDLPQRWISRVVADPEFSNIAYVCLSGFRENEYLAHVYKTEDFGASWEAISEGLPNAPVNDMVIWKGSIDRLIVATDVGVFYQNEDSEEWHVFAEGLPLVPVTDLALDFASGTIAAATYGRSMYRIELSVGLDEIELGSSDFEWQVFPNPIHQDFQISIADFNTDNYFKIYNMSGQLVYSSVLESSKKIFNTNNIGLSSGVYLFELTMNEQVSSRKLIIE
ncbi:T9SS type A sorting domain-containing protein [Lentimicrobium sp. S6]|uniref:VPS10 domain-containing protein n=1 Tax=Lentimicrobium sp. S6 TaxID=2735872 RepID=UPI0015553995|nr:T9SS type A sorting domain-containing protein [Lentimicrobium sp. S6]NPD47704.1 T9SS type A sorting domain-containing protein [Lentimicrobium sp. S6]